MILYLILNQAIPPSRHRVGNNTLTPHWLLNQTQRHYMAGFFYSLTQRFNQCLKRCFMFPINASNFLIQQIFNKRFFYFWQLVNAANQCAKHKIKLRIGGLCFFRLCIHKFILSYFIFFSSVKKRRFHHE